MTTVDSMLQAACKKPADITARGALADALREAGEAELGHAVESDLGVDLLKETLAQSKTLKLPPSVHLLWFVHNVMPRIKATPPPVVLPQPPAGNADAPHPWGMPGASGTLPWRRVTGDPMPLPRRRRPGPWEVRPPGYYDESDHRLAIEALMKQIGEQERP